MNKYKHFSKLAQKRRRHERTCERKKAYPTEQAAYQKGQEVYKCPYCHLWHRSGQLARLIAQVRRPVFLPKGEKNY